MKQSDIGTRTMKNSALLSILALCLLTASCMAAFDGEELSFDGEINSDAIESSADFSSSLFVTAPDGVKYSFGRALLSSGSTDIPNSTWLYASTSGTTVGLYLGLSIYFQGNPSKWQPDSVLVPLNTSFMKPVSSNSRDYDGDYLGTIVYMGRSGSYIYLQFNKVVFTLGDGDYTFNGIFSFKY